MLANKVLRIPSKLSPAREKGIKKISDLFIFPLRNVGIHTCSLLRCNKTGHFARECPEGEADEREVFRVDDDDDDDDDDASGDEDDEDDFVCDRRAYYYKGTLRFKLRTNHQGF